MSSDCGCGSAASSGKRSTGSQSSTSISDPAAGNGEVDAKSPVGAGPIIALHPTDGLFLKAEHLDRIQSYARALSIAIGLGTGTGVVYGYGLELENSTLTATAGLAINPSGHPLQTSENLELSIADQPPLGPDGFWLVEIIPDSDTTGSENAYGAVCGDPCEGVNSIKPWARSLVRLRVREQTMAGLNAQNGARRNWLASRYFEQERRQDEQQPWLVPGKRLPGEPGTVAPLSDHPWAEPGLQPTGAAVPLGVLLEDGGYLVLDTWTARRELSGPPGERRWDGHLARRPWSIFLAQVLQFQDQLSSENLAAAAVSKSLVVDHRAEAVDTFIASVPAPVSNWEAFKKLKTSWLAAEQPYQISGTGRTLPEVGVNELPPAGYLGIPVAGVEDRAKVSDLFAETVDLRFCEVRADYVAGAVQAAQHLDRIPLDPDLDPTPQVDILVPSKSADLDGLKTDAYGWVAFVRRSWADCEDQTPEEPEEPEEPKTEKVEIAYASVTLGDAEKMLIEGQKMLSQGSRPAWAPLVDLEFAENSAEVPAGTTKPSVLTDLNIHGVVAAASTEEAANLGVRRADALIGAAAWNLGAVPILPAFHPSILGPLIMIFVSVTPPL